MKYFQLLIILLSLLSGLKASAQRLGFSIDLSNGGTYTGEYPVEDPYSGSILGPSPGGVQAGRQLDRTYYRYCAPPPFACNFMHGSGHSAKISEAVADGAHYRCRDFLPNHLHIYDQNGTPLNSVLEKLTGKRAHQSTDAHIPIKEP